MRKFRPIAVLGALLCAGFLTLPVARAGDDGSRGAGAGAPDEKCVARCDEETDTCMSGAGKDKQKKEACDDSYTDCLQKCGG